MKIEAINKGSEAKVLDFQEFLSFALPDNYFNLPLFYFKNLKFPYNNGRPVYYVL